MVGVCAGADRETDENKSSVGSLYQVAEGLRDGAARAGSAGSVPVKYLRAADAKTDASTFAGKAVATVDGTDARYDVDDGGVKGAFYLGDVLLACDPAEHAKRIGEAMTRCADALAPCDEREHLDTSGWVGEGDEEAAEKAELAERQVELAELALGREGGGQSGGDDGGDDGRE